MNIVIYKIIMLSIISGQMACGTVQNIQASEASLKENVKNCSDIYKSFEEFFGVQINEEYHLFDLEQDYVLQLQVDEKCRIAYIDVFPKYKWNYVNPAWKEPERIVALSEEEYQRILEKIEQVKKLGLLVDRGKSGFVTNVTARFTDEYENCFIERGERGYAPPGKSPGTHWFKIYFFREVSGLVESKSISTSDSGRKRATVRIQGRGYYVAYDDIEHIKVGEQNTLYLAGSID